jgi:hypothetical protein
MRDAIAAIVALALLVMALSLATTLRRHRRKRERDRDAERALGRGIIAEIPAGEGFLLVSEDASRFYYGDRSIDKDLIVAVRVLINGAPLASYVSRHHTEESSRPATDAERGVGAPAERDRGAGAPGVIEDDRPEGIARDRWDVAVETVTGTTLIECGAIRERVSQELARKIFDAIKSELETRDRR